MLNKVQSKAVSDILKDFEKYDRQILAWYTGSGKTNIFLSICRKLIEKNSKIKIGVSSYLHKNIKEQISERAKQFNLKHEVVESGKSHSTDSNLYIFNPQGLFRKEALGFKFDYLIIDEAHVGLRPGQDNLFFKTLIEKHSRRSIKILACTATPWEILGSDFLTGSKVHARGMEKGLNEDRRLTDFNIHVERFDLKIANKDFSRSGEIRSTFNRANFELIKKLSVEKVRKILATEQERIGKKCLIIVPPGNNCEIAKSVALCIGDEADYLIGGKRTQLDSYYVSEKHKLLKFKNDPKMRFLVVVNKCQIGFDMPELESTIDLTMTRNISLMVQRWGRLARIIDGVSIVKNYFYVLDQSLDSDRAEWLLGTSVEFAMCKWDGGLDTVFKRKTRVFNLSAGRKSFSTSVSNLIGVYSGASHSKYKIISFSKELSQNRWDLSSLIEAAKKYKSRTDLSEQNRYVYNMLKRMDDSALDRIFPRKNEAWDIEKVTSLIIKNAIKSGRQLKKMYPGAYAYVKINKRYDVLDEYFAISRKGLAVDVKEAVTTARDFKKQGLSRSEFKARHYNYYNKLRRFHRELFNSILPTHGGRRAAISKKSEEWSPSSALTYLEESKNSNLSDPAAYIVLLDRRRSASEFIKKNKIQNCG